MRSIVRNYLIFNLLILTSCQTLNSSSNDDLVNEKYLLDYYKTFQKLYNIDLDYDESRKKTFIKNGKIIIQHNQQYDLGFSSFRMNFNKFTHLENNEFKQLRTGLTSFKPNINLTSFIHKRKKRDWIPSYKNWKNENKVSPVKEQGDCGSCWAFTTATTLESNFAIKLNKSIQLSVKELLDCSSFFSGCYGGDLNDAFDYVRKNGLNKEKNYRPYKPKKEFCKNKFWTRKYFKNLRYYTYLDLLDEYILRFIIYNYGPVAVGINGSLQSFIFYSGGIYDDSKCDDKINHAVTIVGFGEEKNKKYWIVKNSWDKSWGEDGYIRIVRGKNICGIEMYGIFLK